MKRLLTLFLITLNLCAGAQTVQDFREATDSLRARLRRRTTVVTGFRLQKVVRRGDILDFHFTQELGDYPWRPDDLEWAKNQIKLLTPFAYQGCTIGDLYAKTTNLETLPMPEISNGGAPLKNPFQVAAPTRKSPVERVDGLFFSKGLEGRNIALWQSHGRYWEKSLDRWEWQRAPVHTTVEDLYTQSYVLPFLIPMLENAGAYVLDPRERDPQMREVVCDNDPSFTSLRGPRMRLAGKYAETGEWQDEGQGFADLKPTYAEGDNPFTMGTVRSTAAKAEADATATWTPDIPLRGRYAVYISYKTHAKSTPCASYTVKHAGGVSRFSVNQRMGGGTWIYLGTFEFEKGTDGCVILDNGVPEGKKFTAGSIVTADAVRFGGGMGKVERDGNVSALPAYMEGALYSLQWSGIDMSLFDEWENDYKKDYASRGKWTSYMAGGSRTNPKVRGKNIPVDLSIAFHSDAGITPNDSIVGTLAIYTLKNEKTEELPTGESRLTGRLLCDFVQTQVVNDIRAQFNPQWARRGLWDRSYSESRTTSAPALLLELLSHQNFADMKYGLDPAFRFTVSRAVYKGALKYLSSRYGVRYCVQPLPVDNFAAELSGSQAVLSWNAVEDPLEPTAKPEGYLLYTRIDDGAFDTGQVLSNVQKDGKLLKVTLPVETGHIYSYRIVAFNDGGKSFPSETLSLGRPYPGARNILIVNNFDRISGPTWFDTETHCGFMSSVDSGVPYIEDISFVGEVYQWDRTVTWTDDDNPGFGGSYTDKAGLRIAGNTFDFPFFHGKLLMEAGYAFSSASAKAFTRIDASVYPALDLICGKQVSVPSQVSDTPRYEVFPGPVRDALTQYAHGGGGILVSGSYIGTDVWDHVFPVQKDAEEQSVAKTFVQDILGYKWLTNYGDRSGVVRSVDKTFSMSGSLFYNNDYSETCYRVENPDGIIPASASAHTILRYRGSGISAGTAYDSGSWRVVALGFPLETVSPGVPLSQFISLTLQYICK